MGGEGSMAGANVSLKNNRNQLSKRKDRKALGGSYANIELKEFPKATEAQILELREKIKKENRRRLEKQILLFVVFIAVVVLFVVYAI